MFKIIAKYWAGIGVVICTCAFVMFSGWFFYKNAYIGSKQSDYEIVCIYGHQYYRANFFSKGLLAIRLNDRGEPVRCEE